MTITCDCCGRPAHYTDHARADCTVRRKVG